MDDEWLTQDELIERRNLHEQQRNRHPRTEQAFHPTKETKTKPTTTTTTPSTTATDEPTLEPTSATTTSSSTHGSKVSDVEVPTAPWPSSKPKGGPPSRETPKPTSARPKRQAKQNIPFTYDRPGNPTASAMITYIQFVQRVAEWGDSQSTQAVMAHWTMISMDPEDGSLDTFQPVFTPMALKATRKGNNPNAPTWEEAMTGPHRDKFEKAMLKEIRELEAKGTWTGVPRPSLPEGASVTPLTWVLTIKKLPNGDFDKFKAHTCVRGDL